MRDVTPHGMSGATGVESIFPRGPGMLDPPVDVGRDHILGMPDAELTLVE